MKMTLKTKLISCIVAFIMVASLMMVGIFASPTITMQMGGNVSFTANGVYADITGNIVGTQDHPTGSPLQLSSISIDYTNTETEVDLSGENSDWTTMPLTFDENGSEITVTMNIQNKASDRAIKVTITDNTNIENVTVARAYNNSTFSSNTDTQTINGGQNGSYTFKLSVDSQNSPASGSFSLDVKLESTENVEEQKYTASITNINYDQANFYVMADDGIVQTIGYGDNIDINTSVISVAMNESDFSSANSIAIQNREGESDIELYAADRNCPIILVNEIQIATQAGYWIQDATVDAISNIEISSDGQVITLYLASNCDITFSRS